MVLLKKGLSLRLMTRSTGQVSLTPAGTASPLVVRLLIAAASSITAS